MTPHPALHPDILYYIPPVSEGGYFVGNASDGGAADTAGELVGTIETGVGGVTFNASSIAPSTERRLTLVDTGFGPLAASSGSSSSLGLRHNSTSYANTLHIDRRVYFFCVFMTDAALANNSRAILDNTNLTAGAQGFTIGSQAVNSGQSTGGILRKINCAVPRVRIQRTSVTIIDLFAEELLSEEMVPEIHVLQGYCSPDELSWLRVDQGRKAYGVFQDQTPGSGNAAQAMFLMNRAGLSLGYPGAILTMGVYTNFPGQDHIDEWWLANWPLGSFTGGSEMRVGEHHFNFSYEQGGTPYCQWFNGSKISGGAVNGSGAEEGEGVVFQDGVSTDYLGSINNWVGGPHKNEEWEGGTIAIDGGAATAYADGQLYRGASSLRVVRNTILGASFNHRETTTLRANSRRVHHRLERLDDGRTINPCYVRMSRGNDYQEFITFDASGVLLDSGSVTSTNFLCDATARSVAQWSPAAGILSLVTNTVGREIPRETTIIYSATARRVYFDIATTADETVEGDVIEFELFHQFFETTDEEWEALAQREVLKTLFPRTSKRNRVVAGSRRLATALLGR